MEDKAFLDDSVTPIQCSALRKGEHMLMQKTHPCKVIEITVSKPGKHGSAKAHIIGLDIFTGRRFEEIVTTRDRVLVPEVSRDEMEVSLVNNNGFFSIFKEDMTLRNDLKWTEACSTPLDKVRAMLDEAEADTEGRLRVVALVISALGNAVVKDVRMKKD